jgi:hypothetical protein
MATRSASDDRFREQAEETAARERDIQKKIDRKDSVAPKRKAEASMQAGERTYPAPPLPKQHLEKPGSEADLDVAPMYEAPHYKGSEKLSSTKWRSSPAATPASDGPSPFCSRGKAPISRSVI